MLWHFRWLFAYFVFKNCTGRAMQKIQNWHLYIKKIRRHFMRTFCKSSNSFGYYFKRKLTSKSWMGTAASTTNISGTAALRHWTQILLVITWSAAHNPRGRTRSTRSWLLRTVGLQFRSCWSMSVMVTMHFDWVAIIIIIGPVKLRRLDIWLVLRRGCNWGR